MSSDSKTVSDYDMGKEYDRTQIPSAENEGIGTELPNIPKNTIVNFDTNINYELREDIDNRNKTLDPQFVWRGKSLESTFEVPAPILYKQETIMPRVIIEDMKRRSAKRTRMADSQMSFDDYIDSFDPNLQPGYYTHTEGWKNRMILGDSLHVMASLAENESLRGKVQMIYIDPPYGIKFSSNWQPTTKSTNVQDGKKEDITTEPEMIKAFRDTWKDGVHTYLSYLRERLIVARDLLTESGSIFVQIGDENVHRVRALLDEVFGEENFVSQIVYMTTTGFTTNLLGNVTNHILWFAKNIKIVKSHHLLKKKEFGGEGAFGYRSIEGQDMQRMSISDYETKLGRAFDYEEDALKKHFKVFMLGDLTSQGSSSKSQEFIFKNKKYNPGKTNHWKANFPNGMNRLYKANRLDNTGNRIGYVRYFLDSSVYPITNVWTDVGSSFMTKYYVVQTATSVIQRCMLMATDPGDLVLDPTCGSGTTAYVAEQWGRRWITIDTSRVSISIARKRLMGANYPYYLLADSEVGKKKEFELSGNLNNSTSNNRVGLGFVYERVPHIMLKTIANNPEIDVIYDEYVERLSKLCEEFSKQIFSPKNLEEWEVPHEVDNTWSSIAKELHKEIFSLCKERQDRIDKSIAQSADCEYLYDKPYVNNKVVRVTGPFTVESTSQVRTLAATTNGDVVDVQKEWEIKAGLTYGNGKNYVDKIRNALQVSGVKQARKNDKIVFSSVEPYAGRFITFEAYSESANENAKAKRYAVMLGPEFGSVQRSDIVRASREAKEGGFDILLILAFGYSSQSALEEESLSGVRVIKARMNSDLHLSMDLKETSSGNPFIVFGEPDIEIKLVEDNLYVVELKGVDVYDPKTDSVRSDKTDDIDCWMIDTNYSGDAFFTHQIYFPGGTKTFDAFKKILKNDIDADEWDALSKTTSRPFPKPSSGLIAIKVINNFGDEVIKIFDID